MAEQDMQKIGMTEDDLAMQERRAKRSDQAAVFASWLNSMRMKPDANLPAQLQAAQERRASNIRKNRTVNMLESAGQTELAKQVKSGAITGKTAVAQMFQLAAEERQAQRAAANRAAQARISREAADLAFERQKELYAYKAGVDAQKPSSPLTSMGKLNADLLAGRITPAQFDQAVLALSKPDTVIKGDDMTPFEEAVAKKQAGTLETITSDALSAQSVRENLSLMSDIISNPDFYSGFGAETLVQAQKMAKIFGADASNVKNAEAFQKIAKDSALQAMGGSLGVGFSNADREFVEAMVPSISNTKEGNMVIIAMQDRLQQRKIKISELADQYAAENKNLTGFTAYLKDWAEQNPIFSEQEKATLFGTGSSGLVTSLSPAATQFLKKPK